MTASSESMPSHILGIGWGVAALLLYLSLGQRALYAEDGFFILASLQTGAWQNTSHEAYLPLLQGFARLVEGLGWSSIRTVTALSATGSAIGVLFTHAGLRAAGCPPRQAQAATAAVALTPAVAFFATAVEYHGLFFGFAQAAFWATVRFARQPTLGRAAVLAVAMATAALMHSTGWLLPVALLPFWLATAERRAPGLAVGVGLGFALTVAIGVWAARAVGVGLVPPVGPLTVIERWPEAVASLRHVPLVLLREWLLPLAPLTLLAGWASLHAGVRSVALGCLVTAVGYAVPCAVILSDRLCEHGAYLLPCVGPLAFVAARRFDWRVVAAGALVGGAISGQRLAVHDRIYDDYVAIVTGATEAARIAVGQAAKPILVVAERIERGACMALAPSIGCVYAPLLQVSDAHHEAALAGMAHYLRTQRAAGCVALISDRAAHALAGSREGDRLRRTLLEHFGAQRIVVDGFAGWALHAGS
jgi:hypothetical protein